MTPDFETLGDLLRKSKIPSHLTISSKRGGLPTITVTASQLFEVVFIFDRTGSLKSIEVDEL